MKPFLQLFGSYASGPQRSTYNSKKQKPQATKRTSKSPMPDLNVKLARDAREFYGVSFEENFRINGEPFGVSEKYFKDVLHYKVRLSRATI